MTKVNWERESGKDVEEFVAALILEQYKTGNLVTPSQGDRGIDVRVPTPSGFDIYQIKRYTRPLTSTEQRDIKGSWNTFLEQTASVLPISSWKLVIPLNPTNERLDWLDALTSGVGFEHEWIGLTTLDVWAANNPRLTEYYFGNGADRLQELMASALRAGSPITEGSTSEALLAAVAERAIELQKALDEVDPFYRYEIEIRAGRIPDANEDLIEDRGAVLVTLEQFSETHYSLRRIFARSPASHILRPIKEHVTFAAKDGTPEQEALDDFRLYGAPLTNVEAQVTKSEGPPGATHEGGTGFVSYLAAQTNGARLPPLEVRLLDAEGVTLDTLPARNVQYSIGAAWLGGQWLKCSDAAKVLELEFMFGAKGHGQKLRIRTIAPDGQRPSELAPTLRFVQQFGEGCALVVAVQGGPEIVGNWVLDSSDDMTHRATVMLRHVEALIAVQAHTVSRVVVPALWSLEPDALASLRRAGRLLSGEELHDNWSEMSSTVEVPDSLPPYLVDGGSLLLRRPLVVTLGETQYTTDRTEQVWYQSARISPDQDLAALKPGDVLRFIPGPSDEVISTAIPLIEE